MVVCHIIPVGVGASQPGAALAHRFVVVEKKALQWLPSMVKV